MNNPVVDSGFYFLSLAVFASCWRRLASRSADQAGPDFGACWLL